MSTSGRSRPRAVLVLALSLGSALLLLVSPAAGPAGASSGDGPPPVPRQVLAPSSGTPLGTPDDAALVASVRTALASPAFGTDRTESVIDATSGSPLMALGDTHAVLPASTLRLLGLPYGDYRAPLDGGAAPSANVSTRERLTILTRLPRAVGELGARVEVSATVADLCASDLAGDAMDAVIACVTAHLATRGLWSPPPIAGAHSARVLTEGWIVRPG